MSEGVVNVSYIIATILFILALGGLSNQETARRGNWYGIIGMAIALIATVASDNVSANYDKLIVALLIGGSIGLLLARRVQMTQMPELVAILHSLVGLAAVAVGFANFMGRRYRLRRRGKDHPRHRDLYRHTDRRRDVLGIGHRIRQAVGPYRRQPIVVAGTSLAESRSADWAPSGLASNSCSSLQRAAVCSRSSS